MTGPDELREAKLEKNLSALFTTETRSTRRRTENPDASVKSPCPPRLRGETGRLALQGGAPSYVLSKVNWPRCHPRWRRGERSSGRKKVSGPPNRQSCIQTFRKPAEPSRRQERPWRRKAFRRQQRASARCATRPMQAVP